MLSDLMDNVFEAVDRFPYRSLVRTLPPYRGLTVLNEQEPRQKYV